MIANNEYYIIADKKTYPTIDEFLNEIKHCYGTDYISKNSKEKVSVVWMRYSPLVANEYTGKGSYVLTKPNKKGSFECWEYQYR